MTNFDHLLPGYVHDVPFHGFIVTRLFLYHFPLYPESLLYSRVPGIDQYKLYPRTSIAIDKRGLPFTLM